MSLYGDVDKDEARELIEGQNSSCFSCCDCDENQENEDIQQTTDCRNQETPPVTKQPSSHVSKNLDGAKKRVGATVASIETQQHIDNFSLLQVFPKLCEIEDYYVRDSTYIDGDNTKQMNKYQNAQQISLEDMIRRVSAAGNSLNTRTAGRRTFLIGPPGSGKTYLMKSLTEKSIPSNIFTVLFHCEDYASDDNLSLEDLLCTYSTRIFKGKAKNIFNLNRDQQAKCVIIFDALDRANFKLAQPPTKNINHKTKVPFSTLISLLCARQLLPDVHVIISSRPHAVVSLSPQLRPDSVVFVNNLTTEDMEKLLMMPRNKNGEEFLKNLMNNASEITKLAHNPLFLNFIHTIQNDIDENTTTAEILFAVMHEFKRSEHYVAKLEGANADKIGMEDAMGKIALQKVVQGSNAIKCGDLKEHGLNCENDHNLLFPALENGGEKWHQQRDEMLNYYFIDPLILNYYVTKHLIEKETCDEFVTFIRKHLFPETSKDVNGKLQLEEDKFANLRNIVYGYFSVQKIQMSTKKQVIDHKKSLYMEILGENLKMILENEISNGHAYLVNLMRDIMGIADEAESRKLRENLKNTKFHFQLSHPLKKADRKTVFGFYEKFVIYLKYLRLNCTDFDTSEIEKLLELIIATEGTIEYIHLENVGKLSSKAIQDLTGKGLSKIADHITITTTDHNAVTVMKDRMENFPNKHWDWKESSPKYNKLEMTLTKLSDSYWKAKTKEIKEKLKHPTVQTTDTVPVATENTDDIKGISSEKPNPILKRISTKVQIEAKKKLKELCFQHYKDDAVQPKLKYVQDFLETEVFQYDDYNTNVYDVEPYCNEREIQHDPVNGTATLRNVDEEITKTTYQNDSFVLVGSKGSGKTILANQLITFYHPDKQFSILIHLDNYTIDEEICLKEVLIDMPAVKYGVFDKQECQDAFQWIVRNPCKCNIILDNYDSASFKLTYSSSLDVNHKMHPGELFGNLFAKLLLPESTTLLLSRPHAIAQLPSEMSPTSLYFVSNLSDKTVTVLFDRFCGKKMEEKRNYINQHFPLAWKLCRNPQMLYILTQQIKVEKFGNFFQLIDEICFQFNGEDQESRDDYLVKNSNKLKTLAYAATSNSLAGLVTDIKSKTIQAVEGMMLVKPHGKNQQTKIKSYFINPLIQDHYTARRLKEQSEDGDENIVDGMLALNENPRKRAENLERFHLIRRFCCSNRSGRQRMQPYFWIKMKETIQEQVNHQDKSSSREENINLILDLVEIFAEGKRTKAEKFEEKKESGRSAHDDGYSVQHLCDELKKMNLEFHNLDFTSIHEIYAICKLVESCEIKKVQCVRIDNREIDGEEFRRICSMLKKAKIKMDNLYIEHTDRLDLMSLKQIKGIIELVKNELLIKTNQPEIAYDLNKKLKKGFLRKGLTIKIEDEDEGDRNARFTPYVISKSRKK